MLPRTEYVICSTATVAARLAVEIAEGMRPALYRNPFACVAAWASQPLPMIPRYVPWRIVWQRGPQGLEIVLTSRLDREITR